MKFETCIERNDPRNLDTLKQRPKLTKDQVAFLRFHRGKIFPTRSIWRIPVPRLLFVEKTMLGQGTNCYIGLREESSA